MTEADRIEVIRARTAEGWSCAKIAPVVGRSTGGVHVLRKRHNIPVGPSARKKRPSEEALLQCMGMSRPQVAAKYGVRLETVSDWVKRYDLQGVLFRRGVDRTIDVSKVREMAKAGAGIVEIAAKLGASEKGVYWVGRREGITLKRRAESEISAPRVAGVAPRAVAVGCSPRAIARAVAGLGAGL